MKNVRQRIGAGIAATGLLTMALTVLAGPSLAAAGDDDACPGAFNGNPASSLAITANVVGGDDLSDGDDVPAGSTIHIRATWTTGDWQSVVKVLDCVRVDGEDQPALSIEEKPTDNDGVFDHTFDVPDSPGSALCVRSRLSGVPVRFQGHSS